MRPWTTCYAERSNAASCCPHLSCCVTRNLSSSGSSSFKYLRRVSLFSTEPQLASARSRSLCTCLKNSLCTCEGQQTSIGTQAPLRVTAHELHFRHINSARWKMRRTMSLRCFCTTYPKHGIRQAYASSHARCAFLPVEPSHSVPQ